MSKNRQQHTVTRRYLEFWSDPNGYIFLYDIIKRKIHDKARAEKLCREPYFYNLDELGKDKSMFDDLNTAVENDGIPVIKKLLNQEKITNIEKDKLAWMIAVQKVRTPSQKKEMEKLVVELHKNAISATMNDPEKKQGLLNYLNEINKNKEKEEIMTEGDLEKFCKDFFKKFEIRIENHKEFFLPRMFQQLRPLVNLYIQAEWYILEADIKTSFITCDNPVATNTMMKGNINNLSEIDHVEVVFPLSPKIVILMKYKAQKREKKGGNLERGLIYYDLEESITGVTEINFRIFMSAERYLMSINEKLLLDLANKFQPTQEKKNLNKKVILEEGKLNEGFCPEKFQLINRVLE